jgi:hypothetical protein
MKRYLLLIGKSRNRVNQKLARRGHIMTRSKSTFFALALSTTLAGCGFFVPEKEIFVNDNVERGDLSPEGRFENMIVAHVKCEIRKGLWKAMYFRNVKAWLEPWGTAVTLKITVDEQSALTPSATFLDPLPNAQKFTLGLTGSGTAHATRVETIAYTYSNLELEKEAIKELRAKGELSCNHLQSGVMIESDLKIEQFIYDKAVIAAVGEDTSKNLTTAPFSTFSDDITFVASFGGTVTPTWTLTRVTVNPSTLFGATRTRTHQATITLGPLDKSSPAGAARQRRLAGTAQTVHDATLYGSATATAIQSQAR